jgi:hypothetical protein
MMYAAAVFGSGREANMADVICVSNYELIAGGIMS